MSYVTEAMVEAADGVFVGCAVGEISAMHIDVLAYQKVFDSACKEADRSASILVFALIEDTLRQFISQQMNEGVKGGLNQLFSGSGVLSTANSRLTLAAALSWIRPSTFAAIDLIRKIRNEFAHKASIENFSDDPVRGFIHSIESCERRLLKLDFLKPLTRRFSERELFLIRSSLFCMSLTLDLILLPTALKHRVNPKSIAVRSPENLRVFQNQAMRTVLDMLSRGAPDSALEQVNHLQSII